MRFKKQEVDTWVCFFGCIVRDVDWAELPKSEKKWKKSGKKWKGEQKWKKLKKSEKNRKSEKKWKKSQVFFSLSEKKWEK